MINCHYSIMIFMKILNYLSLPLHDGKKILIFIFRKIAKIMKIFFFLQNLILKKKRHILMKSFSAIHKLVSDSSSVIFLKIWIIVNFIRTHVQDHLQFSIVSSLLFKILQLYSCQYLSIFSQISLFES